tara:strand:+ start:3405 stop:4208 length:804 start_codon:yes stop_codon:yes gene_type:complete
MTDEQRYLFDLFGYLHLKNALSPKELNAASEAANRYIESAPEDRPPHFKGSLPEKGFSHGFAFDRALERLVFLPTVWPIVLELTNGKPMLVSGTMMVDDPQGHTKAVPLHCARDDYGFESARYEVRHDRIFCDDFVVFPYLDDVRPGDGGILVLPGSHKSLFDRPRDLFSDGLIEKDPPPGVVNITPSAGDVLIMPECVTHGVLPWNAADRQRRVLTLRYRPHHRQEGPIPEEVRQRLAPETQELIATEHYTHTKEIAKLEKVTLSE